MERNKYTDGTIDDARAAGCDMFQLKFDGWWCRMVSIEGSQTFYSETKRPFLTEFLSTPECTLIGEYMRGTQWAKDPRRHLRYYVYDILSLGGQFIGDPYIGRNALLRKVLAKCPANYFPVQNYRIADFEIVWQKEVVENGYEGVVFRKSTDPIDATLIRQKREITLTGIVTAVLPGEVGGKHEGRMGRLEVRLEDGTITSVGNGYSDADREFFGNAPEIVIGRVMELKTNLIFASGNVRHGRFLRWRDDK